jgi:acyl-CoA synthetase (AMP-forming)/AMP-acid ligase II
MGVIQVPRSPRFEAGSVGRPLPGLAVVAVDEAGEALPPGAVGELVVAGPSVMRGYLDASLDAAAFDEEGYFRTGDLGRIDERGNVVITGRLKDVIIRKGENVSAKEVEDLLYLHPSIADVAVIGLPDPDSGERVCAVVQLTEGVDELTFEDMVGFLRGEGLMNQKLPEQLELVDLLPRNPAGKVLKHVLREQYAD